MRKIALLFVLALAGGLSSSCAHTPAGADVIVLPERIGGPVAKFLDVLAGQEPKAITVPYLPTIVLQAADAKDVCLLAHEDVHRTDQAPPPVGLGALPWLELYAHQLGECETGGGKSRAECLRTIPLEKRAYDAQHACQAKIAAGGAP